MKCVVLDFSIKVVLMKSRQKNKMKVQKKEWNVLSAFCFFFFFPLLIHVTQNDQNDQDVNVTLIKHSNRVIYS